MSDWIKTAKVGDKVVCVNDRGFSNVIQAGKEYAIRAIFEDEGLIYIALFGVCESSEAPGFFPPRFRPVEPRKTDIPFAHGILRKASKPVEECV